MNSNIVCFGGIRAYFNSTNCKNLHELQILKLFKPIITREMMSDDCSLFQLSFKKYKTIPQQKNVPT